MIFNMVDAKAESPTPPTPESTFPTFTFSGGKGNYELKDDGFSGGVQYWSLFLKSGGTLYFSDLGGASRFEVCLVGGGGGGGHGGGNNSYRYCGGAGGGGGGMVNRDVSVTPGTNYSITVGNGGNGAVDSGSASDGGSTNAFGLYAAGGKAGSDASNGVNSNGGESGGGTGRGGNGNGYGNPSYKGTPGGNGRKPFYTSSPYGNVLYGAGGGGGKGEGDEYGATQGGMNGGGAGGGYQQAGMAGSVYGAGGGGGGENHVNGTRNGGNGYRGVVILRNKR